LGHSEGSLIAMLTAQRDANVSSYVSLEGAGMNGADALKSQLTPPRLPVEYVAQVDADLDSLRGGKTVSALQTPYPTLNALFRASVQPYLISWFKYDPAQEIAKLRVPILIVQGTTDLQVGVNDAKRLASFNPKAQLVLIDGMNHVLRDAPADMAQNFATYSQPALPLAAKATSSVADFIKSHGMQK
ncbi:MAG: alpha/beta hydrolase, partial [Candidatus Eremiobacteraeota bacterium]|nr:alpha/beta hydrolase [Candidatus Eremiobacteraeota bacterium]